MKPLNWMLILILCSIVVGESNAKSRTKSETKTIAKSKPDGKPKLIAKARKVSPKSKATQRMGKSKNRKPVAKPTLRSKKGKPIAKANKKRKPVAKSRFVPERINATEAMILPSLVSITYIKVHICSGSIVSKHFVLTAAHCVFDGMTLPLPKENMQVIVGINDNNDGIPYEVHGIETHADFDNHTYANDVALIKTLKPIVIGADVAKILLSDAEISDKISTEYATTSWYGAPKFYNRSVEETFNIADVHSVPLALCKKIHIGVSVRHICMSSVVTSGNCNEDSGGPLVIATKNSVKQIGILTFGINCGNTKPEVYTRISWYYNWIKTRIEMIK